MKNDLSINADLYMLSIKHICMKSAILLTLLFPSCFYLRLWTRKLISKIDQTEFDGFEYVNPLLMSMEDNVWEPIVTHVNL